MNKIYAFMNTVTDRLFEVVAIAEDGTALAEQVSSSETCARHDIGDTSDRKHDVYDKHFGAGNWALEWVEAPEAHEGLQKALLLNERIGAVTPRHPPVHRIYAFIDRNSPEYPDFFYAKAIGEDGTALASRSVTSEVAARHATGHTSAYNHDKYNAHFGAGNWTLEWVKDPRHHGGVQAALAKHSLAAAVSTPWRLAKDAPPLRRITGTLTPRENVSSDADESGLISVSLNVLSDNLTSVRIGQVPAGLMVEIPGTARTIVAYGEMDLTRSAIFTELLKLDEVLHSDYVYYV